MSVLTERHDLGYLFSMECDTCLAPGPCALSVDSLAKKAGSKGWSMLRVGTNWLVACNSCNSRGRTLVSGDTVVKEPTSKKAKKKPKVRCSRKCIVCSKEFKAKKNKSRYCSQECYKVASRKVDRPPKEKLLHLVWKYPSSILAKKFGVSDSAIKKWCRAYEIEKPPRGYWAKYRSMK